MIVKYTELPFNRFSCALYVIDESYITQERYIGMGFGNTKEEALERAVNIIKAQVPFRKGYVDGTKKKVAQAENELKEIEAFIHSNSLKENVL